MHDYPIIFHKHTPPRLLYHYTSQEGLIGIVTRHRLWATEIQYLNDLTEIKYGEKMIDKIIARRRKGARGDTKEFFSDFTASASFLRGAHYFVTSLSEEGDLLSQWRGYTPDGNGFSLGFDVGKLNEILNSKEEFSLVKCVYDPAAQEELINNTIDSALDDWKQRKEATPKNDDGSTPFRIHPPMALRLYSCFLAPVLKDPAFREEKEWRLVVVQDNSSTHHFRAGKSMLTPYIEVELAEQNPHAQASIPLAEIIVGPTLNPGLAMLAVKMLLQTHNINGATRLSNIPYKIW